MNKGIIFGQSCRLTHDINVGKMGHGQVGEKLYNFEKAKPSVATIFFPPTAEHKDIVMEFCTNSSIFRNFPAKKVRRPTTSAKTFQCDLISP